MKNSQLYAVKLAQEYEKISVLENLSNLEADRLVEILEIAESNSQLNSLISEIDFCLAFKKGYLNENSINYYESQRAKLRESLKINLDKEESDLRHIYT
jgi:hypothetical protein